MIYLISQYESGIYHELQLSPEGVRLRYKSLPFTVELALSLVVSMV